MTYGKNPRRDCKISVQNPHRQFSSHRACLYHSSWTINVMPMQETWYSVILSEEVFSEIPKIIQIILWHIYVWTELVGMDLMKRISPKMFTMLTITCHVWVFIYLRVTHYWLAQTTGFSLQNCLEYVGGVVSVRYMVKSSAL